MLDIEKQVTPRHTLASQLIGYDHPRYILKALQQSAEEPLGGLAISPILNKDVEDNAMLIDGTPEIVLHPLDPDEHFIYVPLPGRGRRRRRQLAKLGPNFLHHRRTVS